MSKKMIVVLGCMLMLFSFTACNGKSVGTAVTGSEYQEKLSEYVTENDNVGVAYPLFYAMGEKYIVAVSYFGMFILDADSKSVNSYVDLKKYDCNYIQGDVITRAMLDKEEKNVYFYNVSSGNTDITGKIYALNIESKDITEVTEDKLPKEEEILPAPEILDSETVCANADEKLKEVFDAYKEDSLMVVKQGDTFIFATAAEWKISNLKFLFINESSGEVKEVPVVE